MDVNVDVVRQKIGFLHGCFPFEEAGAQHSLSPIKCLWSSAVIGTTLGFRVPAKRNEALLKLDLSARGRFSTNLNDGLPADGRSLAGPYFERG
jgi:hypothetical protein